MLAYDYPDTQIHCDMCKPKWENPEYVERIRDDQIICGNCAKQLIEHFIKLEGLEVTHE